MATGTKPDEGWAWAVMIGSFGVHIVLGCLVYCVGIIHTALLDQFEDSMYLLSWVGSISSSLVALPGPLSSYLMSRFSCRVATMAGGILVSLGCFFSAFSSSLTVMIFCYGFITGLGSGLAYSAAVVVVGFGFQKKRNFASGLAVAGIGVGMFCLSPAITAANNTYGYTGLFMILSGIGLHIFLFGALFRPSYLENLGKELIKKKEVGKQTNFYTDLKIRLRIFQKPSFLCLCVSILSWNLGLFIVFLHLPSYVMLKRTGRFEASFLLSIAGICSCVSRIVTGYISSSERINEILVYSFNFAVLGLGTVFFPYINISYTPQVLYSVILGLFFGNCYAIMNSINVKIVGIEHLSTAYGFEMCFCGIGMLVGPPLAGFIIENGGTYMSSFIIAGFTILLGSVLGIATFCFNRINPLEVTTNIIVDIQQKENVKPYYEDINGKQKHQESQALMNENETLETVNSNTENELKCILNKTTKNINES